jgi:hypothetical protein
MGYMKNINNPITVDKGLKRAKKLIRKGDKLSLVYAALELRFGIECRLKEILEPHKQIPEKFKNAYQLNSLNKTVLRYLKINNKIARVVFKHPKKKNKLVLFYTPVRPVLITIGQKLGNYLHYPPKDITTLKKLLLDGVKELEFSNKGDLMGPPLGKRKEGKLKTCNMNIQIKNRKKEKLFKPFMQMGDEVIMDVDYLDGGV